MRKISHNNFTFLALLALILLSCDQNQSISEENNPEIMTNQKIEIPSNAIHCISGLTYLVLEEGDDSSTPGPEDIVHAMINSTSNNSEDRDDKNEVQVVHLNELGDGISEAFQIMSPSQKMRIWIPPSLQKEKGKDTLVYDIELIRFERTKEPPIIPESLKSPRSK